MKQTTNVHSIEATKLLGDNRRLAILQLLMRSEATLSQLGKELDTHPANIRHHLKLLEEAGFVEPTSTNIVRGFVEKYYSASSNAYLLNIAILPAVYGTGSIVMMGSHDLALETLSQRLCEDRESPDLFCVPVGSLDGLIALRQGLCHMAGCHLPEDAGDEYNISAVRQIFPGRSMVLITLGQREQGILTAAGNPKHISGIGDLAREDVRVINRQPGSGTRLWLDQRFSELGIAPSSVRGYGSVVRTHSQVGISIAQGKADAGIGILASASRQNLDFIPLFEERYDLVVPAESLDDPQLVPFLDRLHSAEFRELLDKLGGYDAHGTGTTISVSG